MDQIRLSLLELYYLNIRHHNVFGLLQIIPPGMEFHHIIPQDGDFDGELEGNLDHPAPQDPPIWSEVQIMLSVFLLILIGNLSNLMILLYVMCLRLDTPVCTKNTV